MATYALLALAALAASVLIGLLYKQLWDQRDHRTFEEKWRERERLLRRRSRRRSGPGVLEQRARPIARVLFIVARDQHELVEFLRKDFAAEEAEGEIEILMDRRQAPPWPGARPREADRRRDPRRNWSVSTNLREAGCALVAQQAPLTHFSASATRLPDPR